MKTRYSDDIATIADRLDHVGANPDLFTKAEMAELLTAAAGVFRDMQVIIGDGPEYQLEKIEPKGRA